jgi:hypothetical protein
MSIGSIVTTLVTGGAGVSLGAIGTAVVQAVSGKNQSRAQAADLVADAAGNLADRLSKLNEKLDGENRQMRNAILLLTDQVDVILPLVNAPPTTIASLKRVNNAAKMAV